MQSKALSIGYRSMEFLQKNNQPISISAISDGLFLIDSRQQILFVTGKPNHGPFTINIDRELPANIQNISAPDIQAAPERITSSQLNWEIVIPADVPIWHPHITLCEKCTSGIISQRSITLSEAANRQARNVNSKHRSSLRNRADKMYRGRFYEILTLPDGILRNRPALRQAQGKAQGIAQGTAQSSLFINKIERALRSRNTIELLEALKTLVGSGEGLTPQGDDLLCGFLLADHYFRDILYPQLDLLKTIKDVIEYSKQATTTLSWNLMQCAAEGSADERIMNCITWLAADHIDSNLAYMIEELLTYGSSSGLETLAGITSYIHPV